MSHAADEIGPRTPEELAAEREAVAEEIGQLDCEQTELRQAIEKRQARRRRLERDAN